MYGSIKKILNYVNTKASTALDLKIIIEYTEDSLKSIKDYFTLIINGITGGAKQTVVSFTPPAPESITITIPDTSVKATSVIVCSMGIKDRDTDELEFTQFVAAASNIVPNVSYDVTITDFGRSAEGDYILNTIKI